MPGGGGRAVVVEGDDFVESTETAVVHVGSAGGDIAKAWSTEGAAVAFEAGDGEGAEIRGDGVETVVLGAAIVGHEFALVASGAATALAAGPAGATGAGEAGSDRAGGPDAR